MTPKGIGFSSLLLLELYKVLAFMTVLLPCMWCQTMIAAAILIELGQWQIHSGNLEKTASALHLGLGKEAVLPRVPL